MILNIISTVNGMENEGMRNIASHMVRELGGMCTVRSSALGNPMQCLKNSIGADAVMIFARASAKTAYLAKAVRMVCRNVYFILVQKPEAAFIKIIGKSIRKLSYFSIIPADGDEVESLGGRVRPFSVGINSDKFRPAESSEEVSELRKKYGFSEELPIVLHVGHLSEGRGLEEFLCLPKERYQRLIVASGMFENTEVEEKLLADGVRIIKEYLPDVSEVYRMADVYFFPTRSAEFVISIPLSVMEALACGIPAVAMEGVAGVDVLKESSDGGVFCVNGSTELEEVIHSAINSNFGKRKTLLRQKCSWHDVAESLFKDIMGDIESR